MSRASTVRVAPARTGIQIASAWRVWSQGDEFYLAARDMLSLGKLTFHHSYNWQQRLGGTMNRLSRPLRLADGWLHAVQIAFIIGADTLRPLKDPDPKVKLIEVPEHHKLVLNVLQHSQAKKAVMKPPPEVAGTVLSHARLRSGHSLLTVARVMPLVSQDEALARDVREKLRINFDAAPDPAKVFAEAMWQEFSPSTGNAIAVVPVGPETLAGPKGAA